MNELIITNKVLAEISFDKETAMQDAKAIMVKYDGLVITEDEIPNAKKELAQLRKVDKEINTQALAIDKELTANVKQFRADVKEVQQIVKNGISSIDTQIKEYEEEQKVLRKEEIIGWQEYIDICDFTAFNEDWYKKSWNDKKLKEELIAIKKTIDESINTIKMFSTVNNLESDNYIEMLKSYEIATIQQRIVEDARLLSTTKEEVEKEIILEDTPLLTVVRKLVGTKQQLIMLKEYADKIGIKWGE